MNPITNMKNLQKMNDREVEMGIAGTKQSWHWEYKDSAWIFIGGLPYDLTEGDVICVFSQYGEIVHINLVRDMATGKSKGFAFICYQNQLSTILAVDNLNGMKLLGRLVRVDHVHTYKLPKDLEKMDEDRKKLFLEGCAPKPLAAPDQAADAVSPSSSDSPDDEKKAKKSAKKKKKKEKKKKKRRKRDSSSEEDRPRIKIEPKEEPVDRRRLPSPRNRRGSRSPSTRRHDSIAAAVKQEPPSPDHRRDNGRAESRRFDQGRRPHSPYRRDSGKSHPIKQEPSSPDDRRRRRSPDRRYDRRRSPSPKYDRRR